MDIVVSDLPAEGLRLSGTVPLDLEGDLGPDELELPAPATYELLARREGRRVRVSGNVRARVLARCSRCARRYEVEVERELMALYEARPAEGGRPSTELDEDDLALDYYEGDTIDLRALLVEQILLALPMKLVCGDDCRGLCPQCGANLNETDCDCQEVVDLRMASLRAIRDRF